MLYRMCERCEAMRKKRDAVAIIDPTCPACAGVGFVPVKVSREEIARIVAPCGPWKHLGSIIQDEAYRKADSVLALLEGGA